MNHMLLNAFRMKEDMKKIEIHCCIIITITQCSWGFYFQNWFWFQFQSVNILQFSAGLKSF